MNERCTVWMKPPFGVGDPKEVEATPEVLTPLMVAGWNQCVQPANSEEENTDVHD